MKLHVRETTENGIPLVTLPKEEFISLKELAEDHEDLRDLEEAIRVHKGEPRIPYNQVRKELGL